MAILGRSQDPGSLFTNMFKLPFQTFLSILLDVIPRVLIPVFRCTLVELRSGHGSLSLLRQ
jgi:hypothetical protein